MRLHRIAQMALAGVAVATLLGTVGCGNQAGRTSSPLKVPEEGKTGASPAESKADFVLTAHEYDLAWKKDPKAARKGYEGKLIQLKGTIENMGVHSEGNPWVSAGSPWVSLKTGNKIPGTDIEDTVICYLKEKDPWRKIGFGQSITVRGRGHELGTPLLDSDIVALDRNPVQAVSAVDLTKRFGVDRGKMEEAEEIEAAYRSRGNCGQGPR